QTKAARKLPEWSRHPALLFPPALSVEQSSSQATARYKASIVSGERLTDITGGMGVDCFYMRNKFGEVHYFEMQEQVAAAARVNFLHLNAKNVIVHHADSLQSLAENPMNSDWIYADPARRNEHKEKVVQLADCAPDIPANQELLLNLAPNILIKTSPLLDIDLAARALTNLKEVHVVGYENECKELLFILDRNYQGPSFTIKARIVDEQGNALHALDFDREQERDAAAAFDQPLAFLYEPHAAVLKAGAFKMVCEKFGVRKLAVNSQLYTSETLVKDFPGRAFSIVAQCKPDIKEISKVIGGNKANLTTRNFPAKTEDLRKKWKLKEGGDFYLFATTLSNNSKTVIVTRKA
ncbi:THUMP-like domain-containing protein, partial [Dyadobacter sp.]|uniref:THUMP-like domain-containing protein n=1 Tax=Dyadobacter sp. TaxID=1914288 RepID=UPI003F71AB2A